MNDCVDDDRNEVAFEKYTVILPECYECGKKIKDDFCHEIGGKLYCASCIQRSIVPTSDFYEREAF